MAWGLEKGTKQSLVLVPLELTTYHRYPMYTDCRVGRAKKGGKKKAEKVKKGAISKDRLMQMYSEHTRVLRTGIIGFLIWILGIVWLEQGRH